VPTSIVDAASPVMAVPVKVSDAWAIRAPDNTTVSTTKNAPSIFLLFICRAAIYATKIFNCK